MHKFLPSPKAMLVGVAAGLLAIFIANRVPAIASLVGPKKSA